MGIFIFTTIILSMALSIELDFGGGAEYLFGNKKNIQVNDLPENSTLNDLFNYMKENLLKEREELFFQDDSIRPGVLVLVNDTDWELCDQGDYILQNKDVISFISTPPGG